MENVIYHYYPDKELSTITLNRIEKHNAISLDMAASLKKCINQARRDSIKILILTGVGETMFSSGGDLRDLHGELSESDAKRNLMKMMEVLYNLFSFPVITIALLNGGAIGGGCELATACDIRIAKQGTSFGFVQTNLGIIPGWGGGSLLHKRVHPNFAYQWLVEGNLYSAQTLEAKGWIQKVINASDWHDRDKLVAPYLNKSVKQLTYLKEQYLEEIGVIGLKERMEKEVSRCASLWDSKEHKKAVDAFLNKD